MAEFKIQSGRTIETVTKKELHDALGVHLRSWVAETAIGGRFHRFAASGTIVGGALTIGGPNSGGENLGPAPGFVWDVRRLRLTPASISTADEIGIYVNDTGPASLITDTRDNPSGVYLWVWNRNVVLYSGDNLLVSGTGLTTTGVVGVSGQVLELPESLAWKLSA